MSKRVHELAKELNRSNKEVLAALAEKNVEVKSHMSVLSEEQEAMVKKALAPKKEQTEAKAEAARPEETAGKQEGCLLYTSTDSKKAADDRRKRDVKTSG